ncbi:hypothetical protein ZWY2020_051576 [Hordeum vulgare]|nr:hypothetical protein ZWY2020_051576 [Hordeum vulgare]
MPTHTPTPRAGIHPVQLSDTEICRLCTSPKDVFLSQPNLLELEAPNKVCGKGARFLPNPPLPPRVPPGRSRRGSAGSRTRRRRARYSYPHPSSTRGQRRLPWETGGARWSRLFDPDEAAGPSREERWRAGVAARHAGRARDVDDAGVDEASRSPAQGYRLDLHWVADEPAALQYGGGGGDEDGEVEEEARGGGGGSRQGRRARPVRGWSVPSEKARAKSHVGSVASEATEPAKGLEESTVVASSAAPNGAIAKILEKRHQCLFLSSLQSVVDKPPPEKCLEEKHQNDDD